MAKKLTVCKSNKVIEAGYKLSLNEQRLILLCISKVNSMKSLGETDRFEVTAQEFSQVFGISQDKSYQTLKNISEKIFERYVIIDNPDPTIPTLKYTKTRWVSSIDYFPEMGKVYLYFANKILPYLSELKEQFTRYQLEHIGKMTSIYGVRLYELLVQWQTTGTREVKIEWLKTQFELSNEYSRMYDLKKRVIEPAIKDINNYSDLWVKWDQRKTGRKVTYLIFTFGVKEEYKKAKKTPMIKEASICGTPKSEVDKLARRGESYEDAALRIRASKK